MSDSNESELAGPAETPAEVAAEAREAQSEAREAIGEELDGDGEAETAEEEGIS